MPAAHVSLDSTLASIKITRVDEAELDSFTRESEHFRVAFNLFREIASYVWILAYVAVGPTQTWNVGQSGLRRALGANVQAYSVRDWRSRSSAETKCFPC